MKKETAAEKKSIVIVDDHPLFREGIKAIITRDAGLELVGEAGDARKALRAAKK